VVIDPASSEVKSAFDKKLKFSDLNNADGKMFNLFTYFAVEQSVDITKPNPIDGLMAAAKDLSPRDDFEKAIATMKTSLRDLQSANRTESEIGKVIAIAKATLTVVANTLTGPQNTTLDTAITTWANTFVSAK
jgi:hypothetical protein